ncbi:hypothetical protein Esti_002124 [Eimeria stiedai]
MRPLAPLARLTKRGASSLPHSTVRSDSSSSISNSSRSSLGPLARLIRRGGPGSSTASKARKPLRRVCYLTAYGVSTAGVACWAVQEVWPERSRAWPLLRFLNAAATLAALSVDYKLLGWCDLKGCHSRSARRLVRLAQRNRGVYVKLGQHASAMEYLLPAEYTQQLQQLQQNVTPVPLEQVAQVIKEELNIQRLEDIFHHFEDTPVGAASLAQVHFAVLKGGQPVAVKVQHADVRDLADADTRVVEVLTNVAARIFPDVKFAWLVDLLRENLPVELDFRKEADNARLCRLLLEASGPTFNFLLPQPSAVRSLSLQAAAACTSSLGLAVPPQKSSGEGHKQNGCNGLQQQQHPEYVQSYEVELHVAQVYEELTTARVLVMERCLGVAVDDLKGVVEQGIHPLAVSSALSELFGRLVFDMGFVHADPHAGNILVHLKSIPEEERELPLHERGGPLLLASLDGERSPRGRGRRGKLRLSLLDHGLYFSLTPEFRCTYARLWLAMQKGDAEAVAACAREFGVKALPGLLAVILSLRTEDSINSGLQLSRKSSEEALLLRNAFPGYFSRITNVLQSVPKELILLIKTNDLLRAIQGRLGIDDTLALVLLLDRALHFLGHSELQNLKDNGATGIQVV